MTRAAQFWADVRKAMAVLTWPAPRSACGWPATSYEARELVVAEGGRVVMYAIIATAERGDDEIRIGTRAEEGSNLARFAEGGVTPNPEAFAQAFNTSVWTLDAIAHRQKRGEVVNFHMRRVAPQQGGR